MKLTYDVVEMKPFGVMIKPLQAEASMEDLPVAEIRELARKHHLVLLRAFSTFDHADLFADYCEQWGEVSLWPFGKVLELIEQKNPKDHIFDNNYVPMHWDGMYRPQVPEFQIFHCVKAPGDNHGGQTTFSNTVLALKKAPHDARSLWGKVTGRYRRKMEFYDSQTEAPIIAAHPTEGFPVIRYCEPPREGDNSFINHPNIEFDGIAGGEVDEFHMSLQKALYSSECYYGHEWQTGDIVISDNYTLLHGRDAFVSGTDRHLQRVHVLGEPPLDNPHLVAHS